MPQPAPRQELTWVTIDDFRPGIVSQSSFGLPNTASVPSRQLGTAQPTNTFACIALPNGGLGPMPAQTATILGPSAAFQTGRTNVISGVIVIGRVGGPSGQGDELIYCIDVLDVSNNRTQSICTTHSAGAYNRVVKSFGPSASVNSQQTFAFTGGLTMSSPTDATGLTTGTAGVAMTTALINDASTIGTTGYLAIYPDPSTPGTTTVPHDYSATLPDVTNHRTGVCITHQSRIIIPVANEYLWTNTPASNTLAGEFEQFYYTDPPNTVPNNGSASTMTQDTVFVEEWPVGMGAWGSISAGELFIVKRNGGGYILSGDLNNPTITWLGGVTPTFALDHIAAPTPAGLVYLSNNNGCWLWNGGNTSQKISENLNDDFYQISFANMFGPKCKVAPWSQYILTPNNYVYDTQLGGWWKLDNQAVPFAWYGASFDGTNLYAFPVSVPNGTTPIAYKYTRTTPVNSFSWQSSPIEVSKNRSVYIREVSIRAQGSGTIQVQLLGSGGTTASMTFSITSSTQPLLHRLNYGLLAQDLTIQIVSTGQGGLAAPVLYSVAAGYVETQLTSAT